METVNIFYTKDNSLLYKECFVLAYWFGKNSICTMFEVYVNVDRCMFYLNTEDNIYYDKNKNLKAEFIVKKNE